MTTQQRDAYLLAWATWEGAPDDMAPDYRDPLTDRRPVRAGRHHGKAESGPRRAPATADDTSATMAVLAAEVLEAREAGRLTMAGLADAIQAFGVLHAHRATAQMMGHDTNPTIARLADPMGDAIGTGAATLAVETRQNGHRVATARSGTRPAPRALAQSQTVRRLPRGVLADVSTAETRRGARRKDQRHDDAMELAQWAVALHGGAVRAQWRTVVKRGAIPAFVVLAEQMLAEQT